LEENHLKSLSHEESKDEIDIENSTHEDTVEQPLP